MKYLLAITAFIIGAILIGFVGIVVRMALASFDFENAVRECFFELPQGAILGGCLVLGIVFVGAGITVLSSNRNLRRR